jgi:hypothetical protein
MNATPNEQRDHARKTGFAFSTQMNVAVAVTWSAVTALRFAGIGHLPAWVGWLFCFLVVALIIALAIYFFTHVYTWDYTPRPLGKSEARVGAGAAALTAVLAAVNAYQQFLNWSHSDNSAGSIHQ